MPISRLCARCLAALLLLIVTDSGLAHAPAPPVCDSPTAAASGAGLERMARSLAGMPGGLESPPLAAHAQALERAFARLDSGQLARIRAWSARELPGEVHTAKVLFYPFSGPDVLYATALFPQTQRLLFTGLETVGSPPDPAHFDSPSLDDSLRELRRSLADLLGRSFFITAQMQAELPRNRFRGVTPVLLLLLARAGMQIDSISAVTLDEQGRLCRRSFDERIDNAGVEIRYRAPGEAEGTRALVYLRVDLSNEGLAAAPGYATLVRSLGVQTSYLKSASYLMHGPAFSRIRELLLEVSPALLQDDSGIPYRAFVPDAWMATLYGRYTRGGGGFEGMLQADLKTAFAAAPSRPLPFWIGYRASAADSNLQLYQRLDPHAAAR